MKEDGQQEKLLVNGPIVCFRLEGTVNNIKKVIYLFGDNHSPVQYQTQCPSWKSNDFVRYFTKTMQNTNKETNYDLFFESGEMEENIELSRKERYIDEIYKYFKSTLNIVNVDASTDIKSSFNKLQSHHKLHKKQNKGSTEKPNLRLHHIDVRDVFYRKYAHVSIHGITNMCAKIEKQQYIYAEDINFLKMAIPKLINELYCATNSFLYDQITKTMTNTALETFEINDYNKIIDKSNKLINGYDHENVKNNLVSGSFILDNIRTSLKSIDVLCIELLKLTTNFLKFVNENANKMTQGQYYAAYGIDKISIYKYIGKIISLEDQIYSHFLIITSKTMDLYALRRFLDKDYITNTISYTGYAHTLVYLYVLVKYFHFEITHTTNTEISIQEMTKIINETYFNDNICLQLMPKFLHQCIDMSSFPQFFL